MTVQSIRLRIVNSGLSQARGGPHDDCPLTCSPRPLDPRAGGWAHQGRGHVAVLPGGQSSGGAQNGSEGEVAVGEDQRPSQSGGGPRAPSTRPCGTRGRGRAGRDTRHTDAAAHNGRSRCAQGYVRRGSVVGERALHIRKHSPGYPITAGATTQKASGALRQHKTHGLEYFIS